MDKLIKDIIVDNRVSKRLAVCYKYVGELLITSEKELAHVRGVSKNSISRINSYLTEAGYGCVGSMAGKAHRLPAIVLRHMADLAEDEENKKRAEEEEYIREHGCTRIEHLAKVLQDWEDED